MPTSVVLSCKYSTGRGQFRTHKLRFIENTQGYKIWSHMEGPYRFLLKQNSESLTWRHMVADLRELSRAGLGGARLADIEVQGVSSWVAALVKMAWCKYDSPPGVQLRMLLQFHDDTIALLAKAVGDFCNPAPLESMGQVFSAARRNFVSVRLMEQGFRELATVGHKSETAWVDAMLHWIRKQPRGPSVAEVSLLQTTDQLLSLMKGPSPADPEAVAILLRRWLDSEQKPLAHGDLRGMGFTCTAVFMQWLVERVGPEGFLAMVVNDPQSARRFAEGFLTHANAKIDFYKHCRGGGGAGWGMNCALRRIWESLKVWVLGFGGGSTSFLNLRSSEGIR